MEEKKEKEEVLVKPIELNWVNKLAQGIDKIVVGDKIDRKTLRKKHWVRFIIYYTTLGIALILSIFTAFIPLIYWIFVVRGVGAKKGRLMKDLTTTTCYECGAEIDLVDRWECSCGDISRRHIYDECGSCKKYLSIIGCPSCETTLDV